jgi:predicted anti-sigma-YlaC factor YlaD
VHSADAIPDLTPAIMAAIGHERAPVSRVALIARWALGIVAVLKLFLDAQQLLTGQVIFHAPRELISFDIALAVGFLSAAWRPVRAYGMLPLVAALVILLVTTPGLHPPVASGGYSGLLSESTHILQLAGFGFVWVLARTTPRPVGSAMLPRRRLIRGAH